jgi:hypothetical protein
MIWLCVVSFSDHKTIFADISKSEIFGLIWLLLEIILTRLISIICRVILLITNEIGVRNIDIVISELSSFILNSSVYIIIAKIFWFVVIVMVILIVLFLSNLRHFFIFDQWLIHLKSFRLVFYEVTSFILLIAHLLWIFELYKLTILLNQKYK